MNKKVKSAVRKKNQYDDSEDKNIRKVAYFEDNSSKLLLVILIVIFLVVLGITLAYIKKYYQVKGDAEILNVVNKNNHVSVINDGHIEEEITTNTFANDEDYVIKKINTLEMSTNKDKEKDGIIYYDVKYNISENDFTSNSFATNDSEVLVRFSYSYDNENWEYVTNVISTTESTLTPLMGNYYDIAGLVSNLRVATNSEISSKPGKSNMIYWRSETIFKNKLRDSDSRKFTADFKIEYKESK